MTPRESLAAAIAERAAAEEAVRLAQESLEGADRLVDDLTAAVEAFAGVGERIAAERSAAVKAAVAAGTRPVFDPSPELADAMTRKAEADNQLSAVRQARDDIHRELTTGKTALAMARERVGAAINAVIRDDAETMAKEVEAIEAKAAAIRIKIDGAQHVPDAWRTRPGLIEARVYSKQDRTEVGVRNTADWHAAEAYRGKWRELATKLATDPAATLDGGNDG
jgi:hypothetical protein